MKQPPVLYLIIPCYNEEEVLSETAKRLNEKMATLIAENKITNDSRVMFIDDGSQDKTWSMIESLHLENKLFVGVKLSRNKGQQNALLAGLTEARKKADLTISIDVDLQDDINVIDGMLEEAAKGAEIVYGVRSSRKKDTFFKRFTARSFYKLMIKMGVDMVYDHSECRLLSKTAIDALLEYQESNLFLRGVIPQLGYQNAKVEYERHERFAGKSKYSLRKLVALAVSGVTSCSLRPLNGIFGWGLGLSFLGLVAFITTLVLHFTISLGVVWPILSAMLLLVGILLIALGVIGLYVGKTYMETKQRPRFFIEEVVE